MFLLPFALWSQHSSNNEIKQLKTVDITGERLRQITAGLKIETIDSLELSHYISSNLADIISAETTLYIKSYGLGSLSDISIRGTSAVQNAIFWNGFNINVANIGLSDLALLPGSFFNKVKILYGGSSSIYGSGIIGGSIHLQNEPVFADHKSFNISSSAGSFNTFNENLRAVISNNHLCSITAITLNSAENNFPYTNIAKFNSPDERLQNAATYSNGIMQHISEKISEKQTLDAAMWYQYDKREIPPSLTENLSEAKQKDESLRSTLQWKRTTDDLQLVARGAYFYDFENYIDPLSSINSKIINNTGIIELEFNKQLYCHACAESNDSGKTYSESYIRDNTFNLNAGINYQLNQANISAYKGIKQRNDVSVFASVSHNFTPIDWLAALNVRQEFSQGYNVPLAPSFGLEGKIWKFISCRMNISGNFRSPTMNELYWIPGGNLNLKPETSFNQEAGIVLKPQSENVSHFKNVKHLSELSITFFNSKINNLIQWIPINSEISSPQNIEEVSNRGAELKGKYAKLIGNCQLSINLAYTYTRSTNQKKLSKLDNSFGKQLIYIPENSALASISLSYNNIVFNYSQSYIDRRFTTSDNTSSLQGYSVGNFYLSKQFKIHKTGFGIQFNIDNIWNVSYEAIQYRPMPGRIFRIMLNFKC